MLPAAPNGKYRRAILGPLAVAASALSLAGYQPSPLLPLDGAYTAPDGGTISLAVSEDSLLLTDTRTGELRQLTPTEGATFSFGPAYLVQAPVRGTVSVDGDTLTRQSEAPVAARRLAVRRERVSFRNGRVRLVGKVTVPPGTGRRPAIAIVHGSEAGDRDNEDLYVNLFTSLGFVVLSYDKRGVGDSTGLYVEEATPRNVRNLAGDAAAGLRLLARRPDVDPKRIGLFGASQAGWIIPRVVVATHLPRFAVILSGPAMSVGEQAVYSGITGGGSLAPSEAAVRRRMHGIGPSGFNPRPDLRRLTIPVLWMYGAQDRIVWAAQSTRILRGLHRRSFTVRVLPRGGHFLLDTPRGLTSEIPRARRFSPGLFPAIRSFLAGR